MCAKGTVIAAVVVFLSFANNGRAAMVSLEDLSAGGNGIVADGVFDAYHHTQLSLTEVGRAAFDVDSANPLYSKFSSANAAESNIDISEMDISSAPVPITVALVSSAMIALGALGRRRNHPRT